MATTVVSTVRGVAPCPTASTRSPISRGAASPASEAPANSSTVSASAPGCRRRIRIAYRRTSGPSATGNCVMGPPLG